MYAEHIIGLKATESARYDHPETITAVRQRFERILSGGLLSPHHGPPASRDGSMFDLDWMAGDGWHIFLSYGPRYRELRETAVCYGFLFDPEQLVRELGALVGPDLLDDYDAILDQVAREVDASLPPLPMAGDDEIAEFMALMGEDDLGMAAYIQQASTSRYHDLCDAVRYDDLGVEGAEKAIALFKARATAVQKEKRLSGAAALAALSPGMEILVPGQLALRWRLGTVEKGRLCLNSA